MNSPTTLEDIIGLEYTRLGYFRELKRKITELQAANQDLERKQKKLQTILDGISDAMMVVSLNFTIISVNRLFQEIFGSQPPEGRRCYELLKNRTSTCPECPIIAVKKKKNVCRQMLVYAIDGRNRQFEVSASPMEDSNGKIFRFLVLMRDVTLEKQYEEKYQHSKRMAIAGVLAAGVAHEINNPLTSISGFSEGLKRRMPTLKQSLENHPESSELMDDFDEYIDTIITECNRCRDIVKNLLTFSPRKKIDFEQVRLKKLVIDVLKLLRHRLKQAPQIRIRLEFDYRTPQILGNAPELKQVLVNIICNAIDAIENQGEVLIRTGARGAWVVLTIQDTGCGIPKENIDRLFDPFFTTKPVDKGTGIGLSTCYNIMKQHRGEIGVTSQEGLGSAFELKFPNPEQKAHD